MSPGCGSDVLWAGAGEDFRADGSHASVLVFGWLWDHYRWSRAPGFGDYLFHPLELEANVFVEQVDAGMPFAELGNGLTG